MLDRYPTPRYASDRGREIRVARRARIIHQSSSIAEKKPRRARGGGAGGAGAGSGRTSSGTSSCLAAANASATFAEGNGGGAGQRTARSLAGKNGAGAFRRVSAEATSEGDSRTRTATSSPPNAWSLCSAPFLRRSRSRRSLRSARRDAPASIGRRFSQCAEEETRARASLGTRAYTKHAVAEYEE